MDGKVLAIRRIHVRYRLKANPDTHDTAQRVLGFHAEYWAVTRQLDGCIAVSTAREGEVEA